MMMMILQPQFAEEEDIFAECADLFAATVQKSGADKKNADKKAEMMSKAKNKHVAVLDGQKSQNMNIMLAKFGSRRKVTTTNYYNHCHCSCPPTCLRLCAVLPLSVLL